MANLAVDIVLLCVANTNICVATAAAPTPRVILPWFLLILVDTTKYVQQELLFWQQ